MGTPSADRRRVLDAFHAAEPVHHRAIDLEIDSIGTPVAFTDTKALFLASLR